MSYKPGKIAISVAATAIMLTAAPIVPASAAIVPTGRTASHEAMTSQRARVAAFMARKDVRDALRHYGVNPDEASARVAAMSDSEIQQIATRIDKLPAGQDAGAALVGAAVTVFIVLLITDLLCLTHVFNFTRCAR